MDMINSLKHLYYFIKRYKLKLFFHSYFILRCKYYKSYISLCSRLTINDYDNFYIGESSSIGDYTVIQIVNNDSKIKSRLLIGNRTYIGEFQNIRASGGTIAIGDDCLISQHISIIASNHEIRKGININKQSWNKRKIDVWIGNDVWIGQNATILPGVHIGDGAIIGANSVVREDVEPYTVVIGNPAKVLRKRFDKELIALLEEFKWWDKSVEEINSLIPLLTSSDLGKVKSEISSLINK